jgi:predicted nucleotidyltransferase
VPEVRGVAGLEVAAGVRFSSIWAARDLTERGLVERRKRVATLEADRDATVVLMGSWGRNEVTSESDDDFMVVFEGPSREDACPTIDAVSELLGGRAPGSEEIFGKQVWLVESVPVCGDATHARALIGLLTGYLEANVKDYRPPRFLLNDLIRYWRTIAVDFESKMRDRRGEGWGLRNAKLRLSRKALFAGGLLPVLECYRYASDDMASYLGERMSVPPLDRIADVFVDHRALDAGVRSLSAYDEFLAILGDGDKRRQLTELGVDAAAESPLFARVAELGREFEGGLLALLFDDPELRRRMREYIVF